MAIKHKRNSTGEGIVRRLLGNMARRMRLPVTTTVLGEDNLIPSSIQEDAELIRPFFETDHYRDLLSQKGIILPQEDDEYLIKHYLHEGRLLGINPARDFSVNAYNLTYTDVFSADLDPFVHYVRFGRDEGRLGTPFSSDDLYQSSQLVDEKFYFYTYNELIGRISTPAAHFAAVGWKEGRNPNPYSHTKFVIARYPEAGTSLSALLGTLNQSIYHNGLMQQPATLADITTAMRRGDDDFLSDLFGFDVAKYSSEQHDVVAGWAGHPVEHLFYDGLHQNRLRAGKYLHPLLTPMRLFENDFEMLRESRVSLGALNFERLKSPPEPEPHAANVSNLSLYLGVVLYQNTRDELERLFDSISISSEGLGCEIRLHVQDNSPDALDLSWLPEEVGSIAVTIHHDLANPGFAKSHNHLMNEGFGAGCSHYVGLNPDGFLFQDSLRELVSFANRSPTPAIIQLELEPLTHPKWHHPLNGETQWVSGAAFMIDRAAYELTSGFDPNFPMYCEDVDLSFRAMHNNVHLFVATQSRFYHDTTSRLFVTEEWRDIRMMIGGWYLCEKWGQIARANQIKMDLVRRGFDIAKLPARPDKVGEVNAKVQYLLSLERFAISRFWEG